MTGYRDPAHSEQEALWYLGGQRIIIALGEWMVDPFHLAEFVTPAGTCITAYRQKPEDAAYFVLAGEATVDCAGQVCVVSAGAFLFLPGQVRHHLRVSSSGPLNYLTWTSPAGFAQYATRMGNANEAFILAPPHVPARAKIQHLADLLCARAILAAPSSSIGPGPGSMFE